MAQDWIELKNPAPFGVDAMLLLTDGSVICKYAGNNPSHNLWTRLLPDSWGSYVNGTWRSFPSMITMRSAFASAVLRNGRVLVAGGEFSSAGNDTTLCEIFDFATNAWRTVPPPPGFEKLGDAPCAVLPDGRFLVGAPGTNATALFDPATETWSTGGNKRNWSDEESWVLMPDGTVVAPQCYPISVTGPLDKGANKYLPASNQWIATPDMPENLISQDSEIGPGVLLPNGKAFFVGGTQSTALYTPGAKPNDPGNWTAGPPLPTGTNGELLGARDAPCCLLPNGHVLFTASPYGTGQLDDRKGPTYFFEFDGSSIIAVTPAPNTWAQHCSEGQMLLLPTGEVMYTAGGPNAYIYSPAPPFDEAWRPTIETYPAVLSDGPYLVTGKRLNGLSQAVGFGDDYAAATNYPIIRLRSLADGTSRYCRTFDHSTMAVATGDTIQSTNFVVSEGKPLSFGYYHLEVIANGIPSLPALVRIPFSFYDYVTRVLHWPYDYVRRVFHFSEQ
jgi:hypothetical protein